jgi:hypothetical protein
MGHPLERLDTANRVVAVGWPRRAAKGRRRVRQADKRRRPRATDRARATRVSASLSLGTSADGRVSRGREAVPRAGPVRKNLQTRGEPSAPPCTDDDRCLSPGPTHVTLCCRDRARRGRQLAEAKKAPQCVRPVRSRNYRRQLMGHEHHAVGPLKAEIGRPNSRNKWWSSTDR